MKRSLNAFQSEVYQRLVAGETITGPHRSTCPNGYIRLFAWPNGGAVHSSIVGSLIAKGMLEMRLAGDGKHEVILRHDQ